MEQRIAGAEGDIRSLQEWRRDTVEPWLGISRDFHSRTERFMTSFEATERVRAELDAQRHQSNSTKLNVLMVIAAFLAAVLTFFLVLVTYQASRQHVLFDLPSMHVTADEYDAHRIPQQFDSSSQRIYDSYTGR